jgi:hypothetical protein
MSLAVFISCFLAVWLVMVVALGLALKRCLAALPIEQVR